MMKKILKWAGITLGSLVGLVLIYAVVAYFITEHHFAKTYQIKAHPIALVSDSASIARGEHLARAVAKCTECHQDNFGGGLHIEKAGFGKIYAPNITLGGVTANFTGEDWERVVRHGVRPDGRPVRFMPSLGFYHVTDQELTDIVAYIRSLPAVHTQQPESSFGPILRCIYVAGIMPLLDVDEIKDHTAPHGDNIPVGVTVAYGKHLSEAAGCFGCHGDHFSGGPIPGAPPSIPVPRNITADLETGIGKWSFDDFKHALRDGKRPNGDTINTFMPWKYVGQMKDDELQAIWLYLRSVPVMQFGNR